MSEEAEFCSCKKIFKFRGWCRASTQNLVATDAGKDDAISLRGQAQPDLRRSAAVVAESRHKAVVRIFGKWFGQRLFVWISPTDVDVPASAAAFFFNFGEIGTLVPVRFGVVIL